MTTNPDNAEAQAFREDFKAKLLSDPHATFAAMIANAENATNSTDPIIASRGWERLRDLVVFQSMIGVGTDAAPVDTATIVSEVKTALSSDLDNLAKSQADDYDKLSARITSLETPIDPKV